MRNTNRILLSATAWATIWAVGAWYYARNELDKDHDFWIGIPLMLPFGITIWGTIRGAVVWRKNPIVGAFGGTILGALLGSPRFWFWE